MATLSSRLAPLTVSVPAGSGWVSFTPVWSNWTTNVTHTGQWRRVGDSIEMLMHATFTGANTQGSPGSLTLPDSLTIDSAKFPTTTNSEKNYVVGNWEGMDTGVLNACSGTVFYRQDLNSFFLVYATGDTTATNVSTTANRPFTISNGDTFSIRVTLPITGWTSHTASATSANAVVVGGQSVGSKLNIGATSAQGVALLANNAAVLDSNSTGLTALKFSPSQASSADVNTLDDYEEGTFTPIATGTTLNGVGTYTSQTGTYTKIGDLVYFTLFIEWSAHTGTGDIRIGQLPFAARNITNAFHNITGVTHNNLTHPANSIVQAFISPNTDYLNMFTFVAGSSTRTLLAMDTACGFYISGSYKAAT